MVVDGGCGGEYWMLDVGCWMVDAKSPSPSVGRAADAQLAVDLGNACRWPAGGCSQHVLAYCSRPLFIPCRLAKLQALVQGGRMHAWHVHAARKHLLLEEIDFSALPFFLVSRSHAIWTAGGAFESTAPIMQCMYNGVVWQPVGPAHGTHALHGAAARMPV